MRGSFDDIPVTTLFPLLSHADVDVWRQAARTLDAARCGEDATDWEWFPEHAAFSPTQERTPIILGLDVIGNAEQGDQLEFLLQVAWTDLGQLAVEVMVNVACWCETDHATHDVDTLRVVVGEETSLPEAFCVGARRLTSWLADPRDADHWRATAGLPPRRTS